MPVVCRVAFASTLVAFTGDQLELKQAIALWKERPRVRSQRLLPLDQTQTVGAGVQNVLAPCVGRAKGLRRVLLRTVRWVGFAIPTTELQHRAFRPELRVSAVAAFDHLLGSRAHLSAELPRRHRLPKLVKRVQPMGGE